MDKFCTKNIYELLREKGTRGPWKKLFWFKHSVPRFIFSLWLANLNRLPTLCRLANWGINTDRICVLCRREPGDRNHLFFKCPYTMPIWKEGTRRCCTVIPNSEWEEIINWMRQHGTSNCFRKYTVKLFWSATVYRIWQERNARMHAGMPDE